MSINQESLLLNSIPNSAITVSQMHKPPKSHFQMTVGGVKKLFCGRLSKMSDITLNFISNMQNIFSNSFIILGRKHFYL